MPAAYFDHNATTPLAPAAWEAMRAAYFEQFGNASSIHRQGQAAKALLEAARESVAELLGARPAEIVFTSGGTEADNLAIQGIAALHPGGHLVTTQIEHPAALNTCRELEQRGWSVTYLPVNAQGLVSAEDVRQALRPDTALVSVVVANNETSVIQPIEEIAAVTRAAKVALHVDAVQGAGKLPIDVRRLSCDLLSISGHKLYGPQGTGALYVRRGTRLQPLFYGGHHERERRAGTENVPGLAGLGAAARLAAAELASEAARLTELRDRFERAVLATIPLARVIGAGAPRVPNTSNICFPHVEGEALVIALDLAGFCVSTGAACSSGAVEPSHVLLAMGLPRHEARSCLRFSFGRSSDWPQIEALLAALAAAVERLRALSPGWQPDREPAEARA